MTAPRRLADIAADLRAKLSAKSDSYRQTRESIAVELDALDAVLVPRPDPDTIAELRADVAILRRDSSDTRWGREFADRLAAFLDTFAPPPADDDVDWRALVGQMLDAYYGNADSHDIFIQADEAWNRAALAAHPAPAPNEGAVSLPPSRLRPPTVPKGHR